MADFLWFLLQGLPETIGMTALAVVAAKRELNWKEVILVGTGLTLIIFLVKKIDLFFGLHTLVCLLLLMFFLIKFKEVSVIKGFTSSLIAFLTLAVLEVLSNSIYKMVGLNLDALAQKSLDWAVLGLPQAIIMIILSLLLAKKLAPSKKL